MFFLSFGFYLTKPLFFQSMHFSSYGILSEVSLVHKCKCLRIVGVVLEEDN